MQNRQEKTTTTAYTIIFCCFCLNIDFETKIGKVVDFETKIDNSKKTSEKRLV